METFEMRKGDNFHVHFRRKEVLTRVLPFTAQYFGRALVMPNTKPRAILTATDALEYQAEIMQAADMVLCLHGEDPSHAVPGMDKEKSFLTILEKIVKAFPALRIVLEHISTKDAVDFVRQAPNNVAATIAPHYLMLVHDDVIGYSEASKCLMQPHWHCKPTPKNPDDRRALADAATSGNSKFFYGDDSAPHLRRTKEAPGVCAGVFVEPASLPLLIQIFEKKGKLEQLENFVSVFGAGFYGLNPLFNSAPNLVFVKKDWVVPDFYPVPELHDELVPYLAKQKLAWKLVK